MKCTRQHAEGKHRQVSLCGRPRYRTESYKSEWNRGKTASVALCAAEALVFGSELLSICRYLHIGGYLKGDFLLFERIKEDIKCFCERDPAATSAIEVMLLYNGLHATIDYRIAHWFYRHRCFFIARAISQWSKMWTGIEIHPGATIGRRLVIDHGTGIVIGETAEIGDDCLLYQGVTLGGTGKDVGKRHPTLGNNVMVGSGAKVLGPFRVGDNARIAANAVVLREVPEGATVVGVPGRIVRLCGDKLDHIHTPDPVMLEIEALKRRMALLEEQINDTKKET